MKVVNLGLLIIFNLLHILVQSVECSDSPSPEDKHVIKSKPTSPSSSSSSKQTSPQRIWEDKHVVNEHISTSLFY